jgi:hypothetical protein
VSPAHVLEFLEASFQIGLDRVQVVCFHLADLLLWFTSHDDTDWVLHAPTPLGVGLIFVFQWQRCQTGALFSPLHYKVMQSITNIPTHAWSVDSTQAVLGSSYLIFETLSRSLDRSNILSFMVIGLSLHPRYP